MRTAITWTTVPRGRGADGSLELSVLVSPRLTPDAQKAGDPEPTLAEAPLFSDWPRLVADLSFGLDGLGPLEVVSPPSDSALWAAVFPPTTPVRPFSMPPFHAALVHSYPSVALHAFVKDQWLAAAKTSPVSLPTVADLASEERFGQLGHVGGMSLFDIARLGRGFQGTEVAQNVLALLRFHRPRIPASKDVMPPVTRIEPDFHELVTLVSAHRPVMVALGLLVDLRFEVGPIADTALPARMRVVTSPGIGGSVTPSTEVDVTSGRFFAASRAGAPPGVPPAVAAGLLPLGPGSGYELQAVDVDGAVMKATAFALTLDHLLAHATLGTPEREGLPTLRTGGIALVRDRRALRFNQAQTDAHKLNDQLFADGGDDLSKGIALMAEDLFKGVRVDVWDDGSQAWHSLCARRAVYRFPKLHRLLRADDDGEGTITTSVTSGEEQPGPGGAELYLPESLLRWDGWGLCAPRPGIPLVTEGLQPTVTSPAEAASPPPDFGMVVETSPVDRSLPRLRFGRRYRFRARSVDVAGNSVSMEEATQLVRLAGQGAGELTTPPLWFGRFEPVSPPSLVFRTPPSDGEAPDRVVVRSDPEFTTVDHAASRHVAPPQVAVNMAELHGVFDDLDHDGLRAVYHRLVEPPVWRPGQRSRPIEKKELHELQVHPHPQFQIDYPPDPGAAGAALFVGEGTLGAGLLGAEPWATVAETTFAAPGEWPDAKSSLLELVPVPEGEPARVTVSGGTTIHVELPQAVELELHLACRLRDRDALLGMAIWQWLVEDGEGRVVAQDQEQHAIDGKWWMLTPRRTLHLVHAVPRPLHAPLPEFAPEAQRSEGETAAPILGHIVCDAKSTASLDVTSSWDEWVDIGDDPTIPQPRQGHVAKLVVERSQDVVELTGARGEARLVHQLPDAKYRRVTYSAVATTRFAEYFPAPTRLGDSRTVATPETPVDKRSTVVVPSSSRPIRPSVRAIVPSFRWKTTFAKGPQKVTVRRSRLGGLRIYVNRPWWSSGGCERLAVLFAADTRFARLGKRAGNSVTQWAVDPADGTGATTTAAPASAFRNAAEVVRLPGLGSQPHAALYDVEWDAERKVWFCDVEIDLASSPSERPSFPFVRLALARYQPHSLDTCRLSPVVLADFVQLPPDREATVSVDRRDPASVRVKVAGPAGSLAPSFTAHFEALAVNFLGWTEVPGEGPMQGKTVRFPRDASGEELAWREVPGTRITLRRAPKGSDVFSGSLRLPDPVAVPHRIAITGYDSLRSDGATEPEDRITYADHVELAQFGV